MFKRFLVLSVFIATLLLSTNAVFPQSSTETISCDYITTPPGMPAIVMKFFKKDEALRMETVLQGKQVIMIKKANKMITIYPEQNMAIETPLSEEDVNKMKNGSTGFGKTPQEYKEYFSKMDKFKTGEDIIDGRACDIYEIPVDAQGKSRAWVAKDSGWPLKVIWPAPEGETIIEMKNLKINEPLSDSLFEIPAGVKMMNMSDMMQGVQKIMDDPEMKEEMKKMMEKYKKR